MAFLCPARRKKSKIKIGARPLEAPIPGRITGSASIDTLVRVGLEKQYGTRTPMVVLHDFFPCVDDELSVKRNQVVHLLYQENDWMYVIADGGKEGFIPYTYCLPVQRSVDDFVVPQQKSKKKRSSEDQENLIAPHEKYKELNEKYKEPHEKYKDVTLRNHRQMEHKPLVRTASKSLPDISDVGTNSSGGSTTGFMTSSARHHSRHPYHSDSGRPLSQNFGYSNKAYHKSSTSSHHGSKGDNGLLANGDDSLLDTSVADLRIASAQIREKQKQLIQSQKLSKSRENNSTAGTEVRQHKSAPSSPRSAHSHHSNTSISHSHHSSRSSTSAHRNHKHIQNVSQKYPPNASHNYQYIQGHNTHARTHSTHSHGNRSRSGSVGASDDPLNKSWGPTSSGQPLHQSGGRSLNSSYPVGMYSSSRSYTSHPYGLSSNHHSKNQHSQSTSAVQKSNHQSSSKSVEARKFNKTLQGQYIVLFQFTAQQENDISVERGEFVTVLNKEDTDWYWIRRSDNQEGFVPSNYVQQADSIPIHTSPRHSSGPSSPQSSVANSSINHHHHHPNTQHSQHTQHTQPIQHTQHTHNTAPTAHAANAQPNNQQTNQNAPRGSSTGSSTRLVCLYDYRAQAPDDLTVSRGEWLYSDFNKQDDPDWLWVFSPSQSKAGYIPRTYAKPPNFASMQNNRDYDI